MEHWILELIETRRGRVVVAMLMSSVGLLFWWIAWPDVRDARRLRGARTEVDAEVVAARTTRDQHLTSDHQIKYRFQVPGRPGWYTREERGTGRADLWTTVPAPEWERARAARTIKVVYVPCDPRINRAACDESASASDAMGGLILGALCLCGGALWFGRLTVKP